MFSDLFVESIIWCQKPIALAVDGWRGTATNGIHFPMSIVIIHHMKIPMSTSWHPLNKPFSKMVEGNGDLHVLVLCVGITVAQEHDLVMVSHVIVGDGDGCGSMDGIDEPIPAIRQRAMIHPNMASTKN